MNTTTWMVPLGAALTLAVACSGGESSDSGVVATGAGGLLSAGGKPSASEGMASGGIASGATGRTSTTGGPTTGGSSTGSASGGRNSADSGAIGGGTSAGSGGTTGTPTTSGGMQSSSPEATQCGDSKLGAEEMRTRYQSAAAPVGTACQAETQKRLCKADGWGPWSGTFLFDACAPSSTHPGCGATRSGDTERRTRYKLASVPYGGVCEAEVQERTCVGSNWSAFSGTFTAASCAVEAPASCGPVASGSSARRTRYQTATVANGKACVSEIQTALCTNGKLGDYSGSFLFDACIEGPAKDCDGGSHGTSRSQVRYLTPVVEWQKTCTQEIQTQICSNGSWSDWSGTYQSATCVVAPPKACPDGSAHGTSRAQIRYQSASVLFGQDCQGETQTQTCTNGIWSPWNGAYEQASCVVLAPANCAGGDHGTSQSRSMYASATVANGSSCVPEAQTRICNNGDWSPWSGTYTYASCVVDPPFFGSCTFAHQGEKYECDEFPGTAFNSTIVLNSCVMGTYSTDRCAAADRLGVCIMSGGTDTETNLFIYRSATYPTLEAAKEACSSGTFTP